ncbi:MAG: hypothetical protein D6E12_05180 [Desulfovibrio sp.]|nr:MAG: hypothetical protein D6E12_05180 [Desulfovibrio sp.]
MRHTRPLFLAAATALFALAPTVAHANTALPWYSSLGLPLLVLYVLILPPEWAILRWRLQLSRLQALKVAAGANLVSTLAGLALFYGVLAGEEALQRDLLGDAGMPGVICLLAMCFALSWWLEFLCARAMLRREGRDTRGVAGAVLLANVLSYAFLGSVALLPYTMRFFERLTA